MSGYSYQCSLFVDWCSAAHVEALPALPATLAAVWFGHRRPLQVGVRSGGFATVPTDVHRRSRCHERVTCRSTRTWIHVVLPGRLTQVRASVVVPCGRIRLSRNILVSERSTVQSR
ncbi:hypothetical protein CH254_24195 [Rhodococcus sp. 06-412-2C]|nr:hypothetical protein CH254_24195 [Rhodococcus sp. 06-412-2C]OZC94172.1 hypothetical protein CH279_22280 [Rhodococcus sp. 06-412-2B]